MSNQQQINAWNAAVAQKQQARADQLFILKIEQEQLVKAEQTRINAELAVQRAQNSGASPEQVAELQRQARLENTAESDARIAASKTEDNIGKLDGSIRYNTFQRDQYQGALPAQGTPNSTVADLPDNAQTNAAEIAPSPTPAYADPVTTEQTAATNNVFNDRTIDAAPVETPPYDEFAGVDAAVAAQAATPVDTFLDPQQQAEARDAALAEASAEANAASAADPVDAANDQSLQDQEDARQFAAAQPTPAAEPVNAANDQSLQDQEDARQFAAAQPTPAAANPVTDSAAKAQAGTLLAQRQTTLEAQRKMTNNGDWRVRLSLAPSADYLYMATPPGILEPLAKTAGVIFPYTPKIDINYKANYSSYDLTHSNYKGYFYQNSYTDAVNMSATFTAQDSAEATYLLAVIHFFRSVTKMFYGQDAQRGAPPPLVFLTGLGQYQFSAHPCVVSSFTYALPADVDYIRARSTNINGTNLLSRRVRQDLPTNPISSAVNRLANLFSSQGISKGGIYNPPAPPTLGKNEPTYVPTKIEISLILLPMQTRSQVSQQFSVKGFANGDLLKGGFW
jgi:plasmid maintenance system antidote protein VapI